MMYSQPCIALHHQKFVLLPPTKDQQNEREWARMGFLIGMTVGPCPSPTAAIFRHLVPLSATSHRIDSHCYRWSLTGTAPQITTARLAALRAAPQDSQSEGVPYSLIQTLNHFDDIYQGCWPFDLLANLTSPPTKLAFVQAGHRFPLCCTLRTIGLFCGDIVFF